MIITTGHAVFQRMSQTLRWCGILCCRLLVIVRSLRLVVLFSEECLGLCGGVVLFVVGCLLLYDHYNWSYFFPKNVSNLCGGVLLYGVGMVLYLGLYKMKLQKPGGPVRQGNLFQGLLFIFRGLKLRAGVASLGS